MSGIAFDTLKLAQRLEAAGFSQRQAQDIAGAISETVGEAVVTRQYLDLRLGEAGARLESIREQLELRIENTREQLELRIDSTREQLELRIDSTREQLELRLAETAARLEGKIADARADTLKWMFGAVGLQTLAILGGVVALLRLLG